MEMLLVKAEFPILPVQHRSGSSSESDFPEQEKNPRTLAAFASGGFCTMATAEHEVQMLNVGPDGERVAALPDEAGRDDTSEHGSADEADAEEGT